MNGNTNRVNAAIAVIKGSGDHPEIHGYAEFEPNQRGVLVTVEMFGLPKGSECSGGIFALHIHSGESCSGNNNDPFADAGTHYNPKNCPHPYHAGDLPPLFGNDGYAYAVFVTNRFTIDEVIGKVIIVHEGIDDFTSQPSGNAGAKLACGKIIRE